MALYQPSSIIPDMRNPSAGYTVDARYNLVVSWYPGGSSAMTAFSIAVFLNDADNTQIYDTGVRTDNCPFFGTDYAGNRQRFSYTIPRSALPYGLYPGEDVYPGETVYPEDGYTNGYEYKLIITMFWAGGTVVQQSASVFRTRENPVITVDTIGSPGPLSPNTVSTMDYTFTATYSQAQNETPECFRWQIYQNAVSGEPIADSGLIYGTEQLQFTYEGFLPGRYFLVLTVQPWAGENSEYMTSYPFVVSYATQPIAGELDAAKTCAGSAVRVDWSRALYIPGVASGSYSITNGILSLPADSTVTWNTVNKEPMVFDAPWCVVWGGRLGTANATLFNIVTSSGPVVLYYIRSLGRLLLYVNGTAVVTMSGAINSPYVWAVLSQDALYLRVQYMGGGLYPAENLYPAEVLYPLDDDQIIVNRQTFVFSDLGIPFAQGTISSVQTGGLAAVDYLEVLRGDPTAELLAATYTNGTYQPAKSSDDYMLAGFGDGTLDASTADFGGQDVTGFSVFRSGSDGAMTPVAKNVPIGTTAILDYGAASNQGPYYYYLSAKGETAYVSSPLQSNGVSPCFTNWALLSCQDDGSGGYQVMEEYAFGKNLSTGEVSNNNTPTISENFTRYPTVQPSAMNYKSGTLTSLIGHIDYSNGGADYSDSIALMNKLFGLSTAGTTLFLKSRKGEIIRIALSGPVRMQTFDNSPTQAQTVSLSWVEIGSAENVPLWAEDGDIVQ